MSYHTILSYETSAGLLRRPYGYWKTIAGEMAIGVSRNVANLNEAKALIVALARIECRGSMSRLLGHGFSVTRVD